MVMANASPTAVATAAAAFLITFVTTRRVSHRIAGDSLLASV